MKQKKKFAAPLVLQTVEILLEEDLLAASNLDVDTASQQVHKVNGGTDYVDSWTDNGTWID